MNRKLTVGSLFSGIGGLELGLEMTGGFITKWQVEIDEYATKVLAKHWPDVTRFRDIRTVGKHNLSSVDCIIGGFPCQDVSIAGKRAGIDGERSGLWREYARLICEIRPRYVLVENVPNLLHGGIDRVLGDLAACGYDAEWQVLSACAFGLPHKRERLFIVAYPMCQGLEGPRPPVFPAVYAGRPVRGVRLSASDAVRKRDGVPFFVDRIRCLGNAVVPQVARFVGECILASIEREEQAS